MGKKLLVVDDDPVIIDMLKSGLTRNGYNVRCAADGEDALTLVHKEVPDLIVLDIMMPQMDGTEVARRLKEDPKTRHIPIVFLTVLWEKNDRVLDSARLGASIVIGKPFKFEELLEKIKQLLE